MVEILYERYSHLGNNLVNDEAELQVAIGLLAGTGLDDVRLDLIQEANDVGVDLGLDVILSEAETGLLGEAVEHVSALILTEFLSNTDPVGSGLVEGGFATGRVRPGRGGGGLAFVHGLVQVVDDGHPNTGHQGGVGLNVFGVEIEQILHDCVGIHSHILVVEVVEVLVLLDVANVIEGISEDVEHIVVLHERRGVQTELGEGLARRRTASILVNLFLGGKVCALLDGGSIEGKVGLIDGISSGSVATACQFEWLSIGYFSIRKKKSQLSHHQHKG